MRKVSKRSIHCGGEVSMRVVDVVGSKGLALVMGEVIEQI